MHLGSQSQDLVADSREKYSCKTILNVKHKAWRKGQVTLQEESVRVHQYEIGKAKCGESGHLQSSISHRNTQETTEAVLLLLKETRRDQRKLGREDSNWSGNIYGPSANPDQIHICLQELVREMENNFQSHLKVPPCGLQGNKLLKEQRWQKLSTFTLQSACIARPHVPVYKEELLLLQPSPKHHV